MIEISFALVLSALVAGIAYFVSESFYFLGITFACYALFLSCVSVPQFQKYAVRRRKRKECYRFINTFITTCSVTSSLPKSYDVSCEGSIGELAAVEESISLNDVDGRLSCLSSYFDSGIYEMFLSVLTIYEREGGDIIRLSSSLLEEATRIEEDGENRYKESIRKGMQFLLLWAMSLAIVAFLKFALGNFYADLLHSVSYLGALGVFLAFFLASLLIYSTEFTSEKAKFDKPVLPVKKKKKRKGKKHEKDQD